VCKKDCGYDAIDGKKKVPHKIVQERCTKCGACYEACRFDAVIKIPNGKKKALAQV
jgi:Na+-translocating ferredoxin:NAD+ oxidoreductase RNF subunit RnfB